MHTAFLFYSKLQFLEATNKTSHISFRLYADYPWCYILVCLSSLSVHIYFCFAVSSTSSSLVLLCDKRYTYRCPEESNRPKFDTTLTKVLIMITMMMIIPIARLHTATLDLLRIFCNNSLCCTEDFYTRLSRRKAMAFEIVEVAAKTLR